MAVRDIIVLNTTSSRLEAQQSTDTVRISGTSDELLSIENKEGSTGKLTFLKIKQKL